MDTSLNSNGQAQARALAESLRGLHIERVISSPLLRCVQTASAFTSDMQFDERLREQDFGSVQGKTFKEWRTEAPEEYARYSSGDADFQPGGGESRRQVQTRTVAAMHEHCAHASQEGVRSIALFTHGGVVSAWWREINQLPITALRTWQVPNCGINEFSFTHTQGWQVVRFADVKHLEHLSLDEINH
jgi:probable phosphoglycerate mutase